MPLTAQRMYNRISDPQDVSLMLRDDKKKKNDRRDSCNRLGFIISFILNLDNKGIDICICFFFVCFAFYSL